MNAEDGACQIHYTSNLRFFYVSGELLFWLPEKSLDAMAYYGFYKFALCMGTDLMLRALAFKRCMEVD